MKVACERNINGNNRPQASWEMSRKNWNFRRTFFVRVLSFVVDIVGWFFFQVSELYGKKWFFYGNKIRDNK